MPYEIVHLRLALLWHLSLQGTEGGQKCTREEKLQGTHGEKEGMYDRFLYREHG